jgi:phosphoribosylglycinamide formyltransferase-1
MTQPLCKLLILISGSGTNLQAFIDAVATQQIPCSISAVISNKPDAYGLVRAQNAGIATEVVNHKDFESREDFDAALKDCIDNYQPDLVILAGFMRILTPGFVSHYRGRLLNIHPSLLPKYPGLHTHQRALDAGDKEHGVTVHFVTEELDGGPAIIQAKVPVLDGDDADTLAERVLEKEHIIYPLCARWFAEGSLELKGNTVWLNDETLEAGGFQYE